MKVKGARRRAAKIQVAGRRVSGHFSQGRKRVQFFIVFRGAHRSAAESNEGGGSSPPSPLIPTATV